MATILESDLTRETKVKFDNREIQVTLTADQQIQFKLKGMKSGMLGISIDALYKQLKGAEPDEVVAPKTGSVSIKKKTTTEDGPMISLHSLRTHTLITHMPIATKVLLEGILCEMLKQQVKL